MRISTGRRTAGGGRPGRVVTVLFGLVFIAAGTFFLLVTSALARKILAERRWPAVPATILESSWDAGGGEEHPYRLLVRYRYRVHGVEYVGTTYTVGYSGSEDFRPVQLALLAYPPGASVECRVDPANPGHAVLRPRSPWAALLVLFPIPFIAIGLLVLAAGLRRRGPPEALGGRATAAPRRGRRARRLLGVVFTLVGLGTLLAMWPWMSGPLRARGWARVPARVVSSQVRRHEGSGNNGSTTWKLDILYRYRFRGRTYLSNRYGFVGGSSSGYWGKRDIARSLPPGTRVTAWVDPSDPTRAVLRPGYTAKHLVVLVPLLFLGLGLLLLRGGGESSRHRERPDLSELPEVLGVPAATASSEPFLVLKPGRGRLTRLGFFLFLALFWNGIVSVFLVDVIQGFRHGHPSWFSTLFLVPFVLAGLVFVGLVVHGTLGLANPRTTLTLFPGELRLGETVRVSWRTDGRVNRLTHFTIRLTGSEKATYRRGTDTHTATSTFRTIAIAEPADVSRARMGEAELVIPEDTMHTFRGNSNRIVWELEVEGRIPRWPDVDDSWEVEILPLRAKGGRDG